MTDPGPSPSGGVGSDDHDARADQTDVGAYYTGHHVAAFVARRALWGALLAKVDADVDRGGTPAELDPDDLYRPGQSRQAPTDSDERVGFADFYDRYEDHPAVLEYVDGILRDLTVCDPAAGDGSLLLAVAETLFEWRSACVDADPVDLRREILTRNVFGVDVRETATESCRRRLCRWLLDVDQLSGDETGTAGEGTDGKAPRLDRTVRTGNSLLGFVDANPVTDAGGRESRDTEDGTPRRGELRERLDERYAAVQRAGEDAPRMTDHVDDAEDALQSLHAGSDSTTLRVTVPDGLPDSLADYLVDLGFTTYTYTARLDDPTSGTTTADDTALDRRRLRELFAFLERFEDWEVVIERDYVGSDFGPDRLDACHWPLAFPSVFADGGFDVVVSNPPYGASIDPAVKPLVTDERNYDCQGATDSCEWFYERALDLADEDGVVAYVVTKAIAFYSSWSDIREKLLDETALTHVFDVGLGFGDVNLETIALVHRLGGSGGSVPTVHRSEDPRRKTANRPVRLGEVDQRVMRDPGTIVFRPITDDQRDVLDRVLACDRRLGDVMSADDTTRQLYVPDDEKRTLDPGEDPYINKNHWVGDFHLEDVWYRDLGDYRESVDACAIPRVMLKVLRGPRLRAWLDPAGEVVGTEKLVSVPLEASPPSEIAFVYAALNHPCVSYYLQKAVFSETTETARVMDGHYSKPIPIPDPPSVVERAIAQVAWTLTLARQVDHDSGRALADDADRLHASLEALVGGLYLDRSPDRLRTWSERLLADGPATDRVRALFGDFYTERFAARHGTPAQFWTDIESVVTATATVADDWETDRVLASREMDVVRDVLSARR